MKSSYASTLRLIKKLVLKLKNAVIYAYVKHFSLLFLNNKIKNREKVVFWMAGGMPGLYDIEAPILLALRARGYEVHSVICDGVYTACMLREEKDNVPVSVWKDRCHACQEACRKKLDRLSIQHTSIGDYLVKTDLDELRVESNRITWSDLDVLEIDGVNLGKVIKESISRYYQGDLSKIENSVVSEYVFSGLVGHASAKNAIKKLSATHWFTSHGVYVDWGGPLLAALGLNLISATWYSSYRLGQHYYYHASLKGGDIMFDYNSKKDPNYPNTPVSHQEKSNRVLHYFEERYSSPSAFQDISLINEPTTEGGLSNYKNFGKKTWCIFTHVNWDAGASFNHMIFNDFDEWLLETIRVAIRNNSVNWIIKIHPHEENYNPNYTLNLIKESFPILPSHISIINHGSKVSTRHVLEVIDGCLTVLGTSGLEALILGKPVILAGEVHYSNSDYTYNPPSREEYIALLEKINEIHPLTDNQVRKVHDYAYSFLFEKSIEHQLITAYRTADGGISWHLNFNRLHWLRPNFPSNIKIICESFIYNKPFIV